MTNEDVSPPLISPVAGTAPDPTPEPAPAGTIARWRWWVHFLILASFPLSVGLRGLGHTKSAATPLLPSSVGGLLLVSAIELGTFGLIFGLAWAASRATPGQLLLPWRRGARPLWLGLLYSVALRLVIMGFLIFGIIVWLVLSRNAQTAGLNQLRPKTEQLINASSLVGHPLYLILTLTLVSFVVAGLREELWRAGMFAGMRGLFPKSFARLPGRIGAVVLVALVFGLGHTVQGWGAVALTALLGGGLGAIMLWHESIWEATLAHGFFDASTFAFMFLLTTYQPHWLDNLGA